MAAVLRPIFIIALAVLGCALASVYLIGGSFTFDRDAVSPPLPNRYYYLRLDASLGRLDGYLVDDASGMAMSRSGYPATVSNWHLHAQGSYARSDSIDAFGIYECIAHPVARHVGLFIYEISVPTWPFAVLCWLPLVFWIREKPWEVARVGFPVGPLPGPRH